MTVTTSAWIGAGRPARPANQGGGGACSRCGRAGELVPVRSAISKAFTAFDGWSNPNGAGLCQACAWSYATPRLRSAIHLIHRHPAKLEPLTKPQARSLLGRGRLDPAAAVVIPLRPGRKHLLPTAEWGQVCVDDARLPWTDQHAQLLDLVEKLRELGFGSRMLTEPAPPFQVMRALPRDRWAWVLQAWEALAVWRPPDNPWLPLAVHLTTPLPKES